MTIKEIEEYEVLFGKYICFSVREIFEKDPGYLFWLSTQDAYLEGKVAKRYLDFIDQ